MVYAFATQYFNLPANHTSIIDDAVTFVERNRRERKYDYIIHDVFTGGAEPIDLFTVEFLQGLRDMLKKDGVIAIVRRKSERRSLTLLMCIELCG